MKYSPELAQQIADKLATGKHGVLEICAHFEIAESTFFKWKAEKSEFSELLKKAEALRRDAIGEMATSGLALLLQKHEFTVTETETEYIDKGGKKVPKGQRVKTKTVIVMPNATAVIFAKKNHDPENYKDKHEHLHTGEVGVTWQETRTYNTTPPNDTDG